MGDAVAYSFAADLQVCRDLLRNGSRTFFAASFLLPRRVRDPATALYAFCRLADDAIDLGDGNGLSDLTRRLDLAYAGQPIDLAADRAFAATVSEYAIPREIPEALLEGFAWDAEGRQYEDLEDLQAYAARVAGTVGAMMALLMNRRTPDDLARATDLGVAMQLTNIARDVGEDARNGRLYLPRRWMRDAGVDPDAWLAAPVFTPQVASVTARLLDVAERLYDRAGAGIARLPSDCRPGIYAARYLYAGIGHEVGRQGLDSVSKRAVVPARRKLQLLFRALAAAPMPRASSRAPALAEAAFLVAAGSRPTQPLDPYGLENSDAPWWDVRAKALVLLEILERLEQRERAARAERIRSQQSRGAALRAEAST
ncbi:MAG: phytoene/squalene synthase family protein [Hyphomicrobium sp.]